MDEAAVPLMRRMPWSLKLKPWAVKQLPTAALYRTGLVRKAWWTMP